MSNRKLEIEKLRDIMGLLIKQEKRCKDEAISAKFHKAAAIQSTQKLEEDLGLMELLQKDYLHKKNNVRAENEDHVNKILEKLLQE